MFKKVLVLWFLVICQSVAFAAQQVPQSASITKAMTSNFPQIKIRSISNTVFDGVFELELGSGEIVYTNASADHLIVGAKLLKVNGPGQIVDLSQERKAKARLEALADINSDEAVIFKGEGDTTTPIYVFTDVDCGYCRKLHEEVPALQKAGIEVQYYAWPRAGVSSNAGKVMHNVWCADDQQAAMDAAKIGKPVADAKPACQSPLEDQLKLGLKLGVAGTPAIYTQNGEQIGGYAKAAELIKIIRAQ